MSTADTIARLLFSLGLNGAAAVSFRNRLVNGAFTVNQRAAPTGPTVYKPGEFVRDRWRAGPSGCTAACKVAPSGDTTLLIGAGSLVQVIEGGLYLPEGGAYCLSWQGSAVGRVLTQGGSAAFTAGPIAATGLTPGSDVAVEFSLPEGAGPASIHSAQFEPGSTPTPFERRDDELARCRRYFIRLVDPPLRGVVSGSAANRCGMPLPTPMRAPPTATLLGTLPVFDGINIAIAEAITADYSTADSLEVDLRLTSPLVVGRAAVICVAKQGNGIDLSAEIDADAVFGLG